MRARLLASSYPNARKPIITFAQDGKTCLSLPPMIHMSVFIIVLPPASTPTSAPTPVIRHLDFCS